MIRRERPGARKELWVNLGKVFLTCAVLSMITACDQKSSRMEGQKRSEGKTQEKAEPKGEDGDQKSLEAIALSKEDRQQIYADFAAALKANYTFQRTKSKNIVAHVADCAKTEAARGDGTWVNLAFEDRFRECVAKLQDSHLRVTTRRPMVSLGVKLREIDGRFFIESIVSDSKFIAYYRTRLGDVTVDLKPGTEVVAINKSSVEELLKPLIAKTSASTLASRRELALAALTERDFQYPRLPRYRFTVLDGEKRKTVELDWFHDAGAKDLVALSYLKMVKIGPAPFDLANAPLKGYGAQLPLFPNLIELKDAANRVVLRHGEVDRETGEKLCYLQLLSFKPTTLFTPTSARIGFAEALSEILRNCENDAEGKRNLVLDLRANEGGDLANAEALVRLLSRKDQISAPLFVSGLATPRFLELNLSEPGLRKTAAELAIRNKLEYLPLVTNGNVVVAGAGFSRKVVALVSPLCFSACDVVARFMKVSGRGELVGAPTAGAFGAIAGLVGGRGPSWSDTKFGTVAVDIPNAFAGVLEAPLAGQDEGPIRFEAKHLLEGQAVEMGKVGLLVPTPQDLEAGDAGFIRKSLEVLKAN